MDTVQVWNDIIEGIVAASKKEEIISVNTRRTKYRITFPFDAMDALRISKFMDQHGMDGNTFQSIFDSATNLVVSKLKRIKWVMWVHFLLDFSGICGIFYLLTPSNHLVSTVLLMMLLSFMCIFWVTYRYVKTKKIKILKKIWKQKVTVEQRLDKMLLISRKTNVELCKIVIILAIAVSIMLLIRGIMLIKLFN
jgi:hypothetical protein